MKEYIDDEFDCSDVISDALIIVSSVFNIFNL